MTPLHGGGDPPWDPFGTLANALWIGGGQWAGKSTVARLLADRFGATAYHQDYHDGRGHEDRRIATELRAGRAPRRPDGDERWLASTPAAMAATAIADFRLRFDWTLDDLRALVSARPVIAEGWGLRPELVAQIIDSARRMVVLAPTEEFRLRQVRELPRAAAVTASTSDPGRAQQHRLERDRIICRDAVDSAARLGIEVIWVDGSADAEAVADRVAGRFAPFFE